MLRILALMLALVTAPAFAQAPGPVNGIVILDQERFFSGSLYGQRVFAEIDAAGQALASENREIEAELTAEELALTELRAETPRDAFAVMAAEFDARVEAIRSDQDAKARALNSALDGARQQFFELAVPILLELVSDRGAAVILDHRSVLLSADGVNITDAAIAAVDEVLGAGPDGPLIDLTPQPEPRPDPQPDVQPGPGTDSSTE